MDFTIASPLPVSPATLRTSYQTENEGADVPNCHPTKKVLEDIGGMNHNARIRRVRLAAQSLQGLSFRLLSQSWQVRFCYFGVRRVSIFVPRIDSFRTPVYS